MNFPQQFFAVAPIIGKGRVLLAGGLHPLSGSRSGYQASIACYDYVSEHLVWQQDLPKNYPFRGVAHADGVGACLLPQNFVRSPTGMYRWDVENGEPVQPVMEVSGWKIQCLDAFAGAFFFSWVQDDASRVRVVSARESNFQDRAFPYLSNSGGKTIEGVIATGEDRCVVVFSHVVGGRIVYSIEHWSMDSTTPTWVKQTRLEQIVRNGSRLMAWRGSGSNLDVEIYSLDEGQMETSVRFAVADVAAIQPLDRDSYVVLSQGGVCIMDTNANTLVPVSARIAIDFLDFEALAVDVTLGKIVVITAGNHSRPGTCISVIDL